VFQGNPFRSNDEYSPRFHPNKYVRSATETLIVRPQHCLGDYHRYNTTGCVNIYLGLGET